MGQASTPCALQHTCSHFSCCRGTMQCPDEFRFQQSQGHDCCVHLSLIVVQPASLGGNPQGLSRAPAHFILAHAHGRTQLTEAERDADAHRNTHFWQYNSDCMHVPISFTHSLGHHLPSQGRRPLSPSAPVLHNLPRHGQPYTSGRACDQLPAAPQPQVPPPVSLVGRRHQAAGSSSHRALPAGDAMTLSFV